MTTTSPGVRIAAPGQGQRSREKRNVNLAVKPLTMILRGAPLTA